MQSPNYLTSAQKFFLFLSVTAKLGFVLLIGGIIISLAIIDLPGIIIDNSLNKGPFLTDEGEVIAIYQGAVDDDFLTFEYIHHIDSLGELKGKSYGYDLYYSTNYDVGSKVKIIYKLENAEISKIRGLRYSKSTLGEILIFILPLIGLILVLWASVSFIRKLMILKKGVFAIGHLVHKTQTPGRRGRVIHHLTYEFYDLKKTMQKCNMKEASSGVYKIQTNVYLLYNPRRPSQARKITWMPSKVAKGLMQNRNSRVI